MARFVREPQVNHIWRFYADQDKKWRWQRLTVHHEVVSESEQATYRRLKTSQEIWLEPGRILESAWDYAIGRKPI